MRLKIQLITEEEAHIRDYYLLRPLKRIARDLGRSDSFVRGRLKKMGLERPPEIIQRFKEEARFDKGHVPMNKGLKQEEYMNPETIERTKATRFKKGNKPYNTKYDGAISVRHMDAGDHHIPYKYIRISEGEWALYHRHIWEKENGTIPEGMILAFKDGNQMNCELENLELITMEENMRRNSIMRYPEELRTSMRTLGKLKKKIKNATKQNH